MAELEEMDVEYDCTLYYCVAESVDPSEEAVRARGTFTGVPAGSKFSEAVAAVKAAAGGSEVFRLRSSKNRQPAWAAITSQVSEYVCKRGDSFYFKVLPASVPAGVHIGGSRSAAPHGSVDGDWTAVWNKLTQPFSADEMCTGLDSFRVSAFLEKPLIEKIALTDDPRDVGLATQFPEVFVPGHSEDYFPEVAYSIGGFLTGSTSKGRGKLLSSGFYTNFVLRVVDCLKSLNVPVEARGDKQEDASLPISVGRSRRDFLLDLMGVPVLLGESKDESLEKAEADLQNKHRGSTACVYGELEYILGYAADGGQVQFVLMPLDARRDIEKVLPKLNMGLRADRQVFVRTWLNIFRWIRTINEQKVLCGTGLSFMQDHRRISPWGETEQVTVNLGLNHVRKEFRIPASAYTEFTELYGHLMDGVDNAILPTAVLVDSVPLRGMVPEKPTRKRNRRNRSGSWRWIELHLTPVGCPVDKNMPEDKVINMVVSLLHCLRGLHKLGFCHYDIRLPNVLVHKKKFILFDFEMAGRIGTRVPATFASQFWKAGCSLQYKKENDLYMLSQHVIRQCTHSPPWLLQLGDKLESGAMEAAAALRHVESKRKAEQVRVQGRTVTPTNA